MCTRSARLVLLLLAGIGLAPALHATDFFVTSRLDSGAGTLRQAIQSANTDPNAPHVIRFQAPYPLGGRIVLASTLPALGRPMTIDGGDRSPQLSGDEQFPLLLTSHSLTVRNLTLQDGWAPAINSVAGNGGCIRFTGTPGNLIELVIENARFENCAAQSLFLASGGAIQWLSGTGLVTIRNTIFSLNLAASNDAVNEQPRGGAIAISGRSMLVEDSTFENNRALALGGPNGGFGGAIAGFVSDTGVMTVRRNRFRFNQATPDASEFGWGGALYVSTDVNAGVVVQNNWFRGNSGRTGGAAYLEVSGSTFLTVQNNGFQSNEALVGGHLGISGGNTLMWHNTFDDGIAPDGAHLSLDSTNMRQFSNNLFTRFTGATACTSTNVVRNLLDGAGNVLRAPCNGVTLADDQFLATDPIPVRDESLRIGVLRFADDLRIVDRGADHADHCLATDALGTARSLDGDGNGATACDPGAIEHASPVLFRNSFENPPIT